LTDGCDTGRDSKTHVANDLLIRGSGAQGPLRLMSVRPGDDRLTERYRTIVHRQTHVGERDESRCGEFPRSPAQEDPIHEDTSGESDMPRAGTTWRDHPDLGYTAEAGTMEAQGNTPRGYAIGDIGKDGLEHGPVVDHHRTAT